MGSSPQNKKAVIHSFLRINKEGTLFVRKDKM